MSAPTAAHAAAPVIARAADAELLVLPGGSTMQLLAEGDGTTETMTVHRSLIRAGSVGAGPHHHAETTELLYVLKGGLEILVGDDVVTAGEGDVVVIPPGISHAFAATADSDAEVLDVVTPGFARFDMFRRIAGAAGGSAGAPNGPDTYGDDSPIWRDRPRTG